MIHVFECLKIRKYLVQSTQNQLKYSLQIKSTWPLISTILSDISICNEKINSL